MWEERQSVVAVFLSYRREGVTLLFYQCVAVLTVTFFSGVTRAVSREALFLCYSLGAVTVLRNWA